MKKILLILSITVMLLILTVESAASETVLIKNDLPSAGISTLQNDTAESSGFTIINGTLTGYSGTDSDIVIPKDVTHISADAFSKNRSIKSITINNINCTVENGAFPSGITVYAYSGSEAHINAVFCDCRFVDITPEHITLTITYLYENGESAAQAYEAQIKPQSSYNIISPQIDGYSADIPVVAGTAGYEDISISVVYTYTADNGWRVVGNTIKYYENGEFISNDYREIDGTVYPFDSNGNAVIYNSFFEVGGNTYYIERQTIAKGYKVIGQAVYYFGDDGIMLKNTVHDGYSFDINGTLIASDQIFNIGSDSYYLYNNLLFTGYRLIDGNIAYFGTDYKMLKSITYNSYTFDANGYISAGIEASELEISSLPSMSYTGSPLIPELTVCFMGLALTEDVHYTIDVTDNIKPGTATLTLTGTGPISGNKSLSFDIVGEEAYTLTIKYMNTAGGSIASEYITKLESGSEYDIPSPKIDGYEADMKRVTGTMGDEDLTVTVTYKKSSNDSSEESETEFGTAEDTAVDPPYENNFPGWSDPSNETENEETSDTAATSAQQTEPEETVTTLVSEVIETNVKYNYDLLIKVIIIATVICGGTILIIIKWDVISKSVISFVKLAIKKAGDLYKAKRK